MHVYMYVCIYIYIYIQSTNVVHVVNITLYDAVLYVYTYTHVYVYIYIYIYVYMYLCIHIHTYSMQRPAKLSHILRWHLRGPGTAPGRLHHSTVLSKVSFGRTETMLADLRTRAARVCWCKCTVCPARELLSCCLVALAAPAHRPIRRRPGAGRPRRRLPRRRVLSGVCVALTASVFLLLGLCVIVMHPVIYSSLLLCCYFCVWLVSLICCSVVY